MLARYIQPTFGTMHEARIRPKTKHSLLTFFAVFRRSEGIDRWPSWYSSVPRPLKGVPGYMAIRAGWHQLSNKLTSSHEYTKVKLPLATPVNPTTPSIKGDLCVYMVGCWTGRFWTDRFWPFSRGEFFRDRWLLKSRNVWQRSKLEIYCMSSRYVTNIVENRRR